jgi:site-specific DNA recombinase
MKRAALYARYSSDNQRVESITAQLRAAKEYCEKKNYEIVKEYIDEAESGRFDDRPAYQAMMRDAKTGAFDTVVYHKIDRNARNEEDYYYYRALLKHVGVSIEYAECDIDDTPEGKLLESMLVGMAAYFSRNLAREAKKGMKENAYKALHNGGKPPLGYDVSPDKKLTINETEAVAVRKIFEMRAGGSGYGDIISVLNDSGFRTKAGQLFKKNSLHDILSNKKYIGTYVFGRVASTADGKRNNHKTDVGIIEIPDAVPAIVTSELWEAVQARRESDRHLQGRYLAKEKYLLTGLIRCQCGSAMNGSRTTNKRSGTYSYYKCSGQHSGSECTGSRIKKDAVENHVINVLKKELSGETIPELLAKINAAMLDLAKDHTAEIAVLDKKKSATEKNIEKTMQLYYDDIIPKEEVGRLVKEARETIKCIDERLAEIHTILKSVYLQNDHIEFGLSKAVSALESGDPELIEPVVQTFVKAVVVHKTFIDVVLWLGPDFWRTPGRGSPPPFTRQMYEWTIRENLPKVQRGSYPKRKPRRNPGLLSVRPKTKKPPSELYETVRIRMGAM